MRLSVLDLVPVRSDQSTGDALAATRSLAQTADRAGFHRYWLAEHHNMPAVAATNPPVLIAVVAAATSRIRVGSGGVMLPNHAPLVVAEQFAILEAAYPGRIDLGIGRAPGTDPVTSYALRHGAGGVEDEAVARFPEYVDNVIAMMSPDGVGLQIGGRTHPLNATPHAVGRPDVWLLGSSDYSARLAASRGLPYVFAHHFSGNGTAEALALYRSEFRPSAELAEPRLLATLGDEVGPGAGDERRLEPVEGRVDGGGDVATPHHVERHPTHVLAGQPAGRTGLVHLARVREELVHLVGVVAVPQARHGPEHPVAHSVPSSLARRVAAVRRIARTSDSSAASCPHAPSISLPRVSRTVVGMPCARKRATNSASTAGPLAVHFEPGTGFIGIGLQCTQCLPRASSFSASRSARQAWSLTSRRKTLVSADTRPLSSRCRTATSSRIGHTARRSASSS